MRTRDRELAPELQDPPGFIHESQESAAVRVDVLYQMRSFEYNAAFIRQRPGHDLDIPDDIDVRQRAGIQAHESRFFVLTTTQVKPDAAPLLEQNVYRARPMIARFTLDVRAPFQQYL